MDNLHIKNNQKSLSGTKLAEKRWKGIFQKRKSKTTSIAIDRWTFVSRNIQVETSEYLDLLNSLLHTYIHTYNLLKLPSQDFSATIY